MAAAPSLPGALLEAVCPGKIGFAGECVHNRPVL
jgi:hypothetical protein